MPLPRARAARFFSAAWRIALVVFHAVLLTGRIADASILEPAVLARWGGAIALLVTASLFQRFAPVRLRGRRAVLAFWLLAALLHLFGPLQTPGHELDLELTLGFAVPVLAFALLLAAAQAAAAAAHGSCDPQPRWQTSAAPLLLTAPRGPPLRVFQPAH